ncbi:MAG TPA: hypothetical protein VFV50_16840 [Bdellovibrionales bacterium]|nr:hypothetical protein [Bdellovibrionales bacterium]
MLKSVYFALALIAGFSSAAMASSNTIANKTVEEKFIEVTDTSDLYVSRSDRKGNVVCSAEIDIDNQSFTFIVEDRKTNKKLQISFDKESSRTEEGNPVAFTKMDARGNSFYVEFKVSSPDGLWTQDGKLNVRLKRNDGEVETARIYLNLGGQALSCEGQSS